MNGTWQRLAVYLGFREDPVSSTPRSKAERPKPVKRVLEAAPAFALLAVTFSLLGLVKHLIFGGDTSASHVVLGALVFFVVGLLMVPICDGVARWWHESGERRAP